MRLIDADDFFERMKNIDLCAEMEMCGTEALKKYLDLQPTAYDVDKVVEELERIRAKETCNKEKCDTKEICKICVVDDAIEIVKQGVITDDVCEWKVFDNSLTDKPQWVYGTTCGKYVEEEHTSKAFAYCPYCGKKIKVVK